MGRTFAADFRGPEGGSLLNRNCIDAVLGVSMMGTPARSDDHLNPTSAEERVHKQQNVFAFFINRGNDTSWRQFDWTLPSLEPDQLH